MGSRQFLFLKGKKEKFFCFAEGFEEVKRAVRTRQSNLLCNVFILSVSCSHFHLDHCGALPYFSEMVGYDGPIYMTHPTKAICPILLEDYRKITVDKKGETNFFTSQMIKDCMKKVVAVHLHQTVQVNDHFCIGLHWTYWTVVEGRAVFCLWSAYHGACSCAGGWGAGDQGVLCRPRAGSSHVPNQGWMWVSCVHRKYAQQ